jgi:hypothetical protein
VSVAPPPSTYAPAGPHVAHELDDAAVCPLCGSPLAPTQDWCLRCGAAARTRLAAAPRWKALVVLLATVTLLALGVLAAALVKLVGDSGSSSPPSSARSLASPAGVPATVPTTSAPAAAPTSAATPSSPGLSTTTAGKPLGTSGAAAPGSAVPSSSATTPNTSAQGLATPGARGRAPRVRQGAAGRAGP